MRRTLHALRLFVLAVLTCVAVLVPGQTNAATVIVDSSLQQRLLSAAPTQQLSTIVSYTMQPTQSDLQALLNTGVSIAPLQNLPMVGVLATPTQLKVIQQLTGVRSIYADKPLQYHLRGSTAAIGATEVWDTYGLKGDGVGVAVLDTGVDATHADLKFGQTTVQNVKIAGVQYFTGQNLNELPLPEYYLENVENTDTTGGHGTHVAGIIGASGNASGGYFRGVAPEADLIGLGAGEGIAIMTALAGFDWILEHQDQYNIRVVNCSWGPDLPGGFDANDPINQATKVVHDAGVTVVFSAGNSGPNNDTLNAYSVAPWVISVAAGGKYDGNPDDRYKKEVAFFSSRGIPGHDLYHPTLTAPGFLIVSDRASTGVTTTGTTAGYDPLFIPFEHIPSYTTASGTSMASPHVSGAIALMVEANPSLTPDVIKRILISTATPMPNNLEYAAGAGYLNVKAAVDQARQIKNIRSYRDPRTGKTEQVYDLSTTWNGTVGASLPGKTATDQRTITVLPGTALLEVTANWDVVANDLNLYLYDPQGTLVAKSEVSQVVYQYASESVAIHDPVAGQWTVKMTGFLNVPQTYTAFGNSVVRVNP